MKSPAFSWYVRDWLCSNTVSKLHSKSYSKTGSNLLSRGLNAYMFLLCQAWLQDETATLPDDDTELSDLARVTPEEWEAIKPFIMLKFKNNGKGRIYNERQFEEFSKQQNRSKAGSKGGSKKQANIVAALEDANEDEIEKEPDKEEDKRGVRGDLYHPDSRSALYILNESSGRSFRETDQNLTFISSRLKEKGVTIDGVRQMILRQCKRWLRTSDAEYLRPSTLFNATKFDSYYAAKDQPIYENHGTNNSGGGSKPVTPVKGSSPVGGF